MNPFRMVLASLFLTLFAACSQSTNPPALHIVRTWNDLLAQPIVGTGDQAVHVGIESRRCDADTAVLVYCIPVQQPLRLTEELHNPLGPVGIKVIALDQPEPELKYLAMKTKDEIAVRPNPVFFAASAPVGAAGRYEIQVLDRNDKILAATKIQATPSAGSPWLTLNAHRLEKEPGASTYAFSQTAARPKWNGTVPNDKTAFLPHFHPSTEDPTLNVSINHGLISVNSEHWIDRYMSDRWLIRWWVNGKPVIRPIGNRTSPRAMRDMAEQIIEPLQFSFRLQLDPAEIGATPKDRIEFQLLYCRDEIEFLNDTELKQALDEAKTNLPPGTRLTQRILWQP